MKDAFAVLFLLLLASFVLYVAGGGHAWSRTGGGVLSAAMLVLGRLFLATLVARLFSVPGLKRAKAV